jgi:hypothetical protein
MFAHGGTEHCREGPCCQLGTDEARSAGSWVATLPGSVSCAANWHPRVVTFAAWRRAPTRSPARIKARSVASRRQQRCASGAKRQGALDGGPEQLKAEVDFGLGDGQRRADPHHPGGGASAHDVGAEPEL